MDIEKLIGMLESQAVKAEAAAAYLNTHVSYVRTLTSLGKLNSYRCFGVRVYLIEELEVERKERIRRKERIEGNREERVRLAKAREPTSKYGLWNIRQLQQECKYRGLRVRGKKAELVGRLEEYDKESGQHSD